MRKSTCKTPLLLLLMLSLGACRSSYEVVRVEAIPLVIDSVFDAVPARDAVATLTPYKAAIDSMMYTVIGTAAVSMDRGAPESLLSNLVADVLRQSAAAVTGHPADLGIVNMGGLRNVLTQGDITVGDVYEILPFENSLCVLTMQGTALRKLFTDIAKSGGQGLSGARLRIGKAGALLEATVGGQPIDDARSYTLATIDYLADGNDGMPSFTLAQSRECPAGATLRSLFMKYVEAQTAAGKTITSQLEGRITVVE